MTPCPHCGRHLRGDASTCPFCSAPTLARRVVNALGVAFTPMLLAACYGTSGFGDTAGHGKDSAGEDLDGDGFDVATDCDDTNAEVNPNATEDCDDTIDNDCDLNTDGDDTDCVTG